MGLFPHGQGDAVCHFYSLSFFQTIKSYMDGNLNKNKTAQVQVRGDHPICVSLSPDYPFASA